MLPLTNCPHCSYPLLIHSAAGKPYWFCCHCYCDVAYGIDRVPLPNSVDDASTAAELVPLDRRLNPTIGSIQQQQTELQNEFAKLTQLKDGFLSTISHELRTPLSNMKLSIQILAILLRREGLLGTESAAAGTTPAKISDYLNVLSRECEQEIRMVNDLLALQQLESGTQNLLPMPLLLQNWLLQLVEPFEAQALSQQRQFHLDLPADLPPLTTDFTLLDRLLSQLLDNACKFTPKGGQITVTASALAGRLQIQVINSGIEIPADELAQVFDKFYRIPTDDPWQHSGTGLGLALAKALALALGGTIAAESHSGQTSFTVELPCQESLVVTPKDMLISYVAYYVSRGKRVLSPHQGTIPFEGEVYDYWGYHRDFLAFWQRLSQRPDFAELSLQGDVIAFQAFLSGSYAVTECARCSLPIPTATGHAYTPPHCTLCHEPERPACQQKALSLHESGARGMTHVLAIGARYQSDQTLKDLLAINGFEVIFVADPQAIDADSLPPLVDLVVLDADSAAEAQDWATILTGYPQLQGVQMIALRAQNRFSIPWAERHLSVIDYLLSPLGGTHLFRCFGRATAPSLAAASSQIHWVPR